MRIETKKEANTAVLVVDVQGDFTQVKNGSLAVEGTNESYMDMVEAETRRLKTIGYPMLATQDWHPKDHISFFSNHEGTSAFDVIKIENREQVLWPPHCVQGTKNAQVMLDNTLFSQIIQKGMDSNYDSYSGFFDDGKKPTGLDSKLKEMEIEKLIIYGLATDYCVKATAMDAKALGFEVTVLKDLCRGVDPESTRAALKEMEAAGISII